LISVVSHHKDMPGIDSYRTKEIPYLVSSDIDGKGVCVFFIRDLKALSIEEHLLIFDLNHITRQTDHPFYKIHVMVHREGKDDDVSSGRNLVGSPYLLGCKRHSEAIGELGGKDMIAFQQGIFHGGGGYPVGLENEGPDKHSYHKGDYEGLCPIPCSTLILDLPQNLLLCDTIVAVSQDP